MRTFHIHSFKFHFITILFLCTGLVALAQETKEWTLAECVRYGIEKNLNLQIGQKSSEKEELNYRQSQWQLAPSINGWGNGNMDFRRSTNQNNQISNGSSYSANYGVSASLTLFDGFSRLNQISAMKFNAMAFEKKLEQQENLFYIDILNLFTKNIYYKQLVNLANEQLQLTLKEKERIESKVELGLLSSSSVDEINATISGNRVMKERQANNFKLSLLSLAQLIELTDTTGFLPVGAELDLVVPLEKNYTTSGIYEQACANLPDLKMKELQLNYYKKALAVQQGHALPTVSLNGGYNSGYFSTDTLLSGATTPLPNQFNNYLNPSLGVSVSIPIFNKRNNEFQIKKSKIDLENAVLELEQQKKEIMNEIQNTIQQFNASLLEYQNAVDNLKFVEKSFEIYREKYSLGLINSTDFMMAQNQLLESKTTLLQAKYSWIIQEKLIKLFSGTREF